MPNFQKGPRALERSHDWIDERSRALDLRTAEILRDRPELVAKGLENLDRWERARGPHSVFSEWRAILAGASMDELLSLLVENSERANRLRQSSPFTGILSPEERLAIFQHYETL